MPCRCSGIRPEHAATRVCLRRSRSKERLLEDLFSPTTAPDKLRQELLPIVATDGGREFVAQWARERLNRAQAEIFSPENLAKKKYIFVGAGVHTAIAVSNFVRRNPEIASQVLILEASDSVSANFGQGQPFHINSGKPDFVPSDKRPNELVGAVLSPEDFHYYEASGNEYPNPKMIADAVAISLAAQNVQVAFRQRFSGLELIRTFEKHGVLVKTEDGHAVVAETAIFALGVSHAKTASVDGLGEILQEEKSKAGQSGGGYIPRVQIYTDYLVGLAKDGVEKYKELKGKRIGVFGGQHGGNITIETLLGKIPEVNGVALTPQSVFWWNQKSTTAEEFLKAQKPGGGKGPRRLFETRYSKYGLPEAFTDGTIHPIKEKAAKITRTPSGTFLVTSYRPNGDPEEHELDYIFVAAGFESQAKGLIANALAPPGSGAEIHFDPLLSEDGQEAVALKAVLNGSEVPGVFIIGPGNAIPVSEERVTDSVTGSPDSINILGPLSAKFGNWLHRLVEGAK